MMDHSGDNFPKREGNSEKPDDFDEISRTETGHGRVEKRTVQVYRNIENIKCRSKWKGL
jgi:hypothetical protein